MDYDKKMKRNPPSCLQRGTMHFISGKFFKHNQITSTQCNNGSYLK